MKRSTHKLKEPSKHDESYQIATVMFIDMVGSSLDINAGSAQAIVHRISANLCYIQEIVASFSGKISSVDGDGMLVYFIGNEHADRALRCAVRVQQECLRRCTDALMSLTNPLRIGIDTDYTLAGRVGVDNRTVLLGNALIIASRLEHACEAFRIMLGKNCVAAMSDALKRKYNRNIAVRYVLFKHDDSLTTAYEFDPFVKDRRIAILCKSIARPFESRKRTASIATRWQIPQSQALTMRLDNGVAQVLNVSNGGFKILYSKYLAKGVLLDVCLSSSIPEVEEKLAASEFNPIKAEVRWGTRSEDGYILGLKLLSLNHEKGNVLMHICLGVLQTPTAS
ncbi:MAG: adenylate/guanylate cyclase domain-containing protein [Pseudomonadota bacterium]|nr:adenylate/guanylate cyclase domain-containing protein [Pseudomonadota bacterium]